MIKKNSEGGRTPESVVEENRKLLDGGEAVESFVHALIKKLMQSSSEHFGGFTFFVVLHLFQLRDLYLL